MRFHIAPLPRAARKPFLISVLGALLLPTLVMAASPAMARAPRAATTDPRFGLVNAIDAPQAADESGASWELLQLRWDQLQPDSGASWTPPTDIDSWINESRAAGREVVIELIGTPAWATDGNPDTGVPRGLYLPVSDSNNVWASFIRQAVSYYGVRGVNRWVIWDSPDIIAETRGSKWEGTTEDYYQLVKVAYLVAKASNPGALIHLGAVTDNNPAWVTRFLNIVVADPTATANNYYFDVASIQTFASPDRVYTLTANPSYLMNQAGVTLKPVWINGTNARPAVDPDVYPPDTKFNQYSKVTMEQQAAFIIQAYALGFSAQADRIAVYRLADNLNEDGGQAFGLVRKDGDPRLALEAYKLAVEQFSGFKLARRVDEEAHPLVEYVRFTFPDKVTHVAWALTAQNATLFIPARSDTATLIDMSGVRWEVRPEGGLYKIVVGGAECNDPNTVGGCLIGGAPWILVENNVENALTESAPESQVQLGGVVPTPPAPATATPLPPTEVPTQLPAETAAVQPTTSGEVTPPAGETEQPTEVAAAPATSSAPTATPSAEELAAAVRPRGFNAILPYLLMGGGLLVIGGGAWFFLAGRKPPTDEPPMDGEPLNPEEGGEVATVDAGSEVMQTRPHKRPKRKKKGKHEEAQPEQSAEEWLNAETASYQRQDWSTAQTAAHDRPDFGAETGDESGNFEDAPAEDDASVGPAFDGPYPEEPLPDDQRPDR